MILHLATLLIGFSIFSAVLLAITHFRCSEYQGKVIPRLAGIALLLSLALLQIAHYDYLHRQGSLVQSPFYQLALFTVAPAFYFFSKQLLKAKAHYSHTNWLHLLPVLLAPFLPVQLALPISFLIGAGYVAWLVYTIYQLRGQRDRFQWELLALGIMFLIAISVLIIGLLLPVIPHQIFYSFYAINIGLAFFVTDLILLRSPDITTEVSEAAHASYIASTLENIDIEKTLNELEHLMQQEKLYTNENLSLNILAEAVAISPHQLSELINTRRGKGFSQFVREYRINEAKRLLVEEPSASVLAIGLDVGFTSQSNFYAAFKQIEGLAPGQFRKNHL